MKDHLSVKELTDVKMFWVKSTQLAEFLTGTIVVTLTQKGTHTQSSKIVPLVAQSDDS